MSILGCVNTDVFLTYIQEVLLPQLWVGVVVIMDNLPVHHAQIIQDVDCICWCKSGLFAALFTWFITHWIVLVKTKAVFTCRQGLNLHSTWPSINADCYWTNLVRWCLGLVYSLWSIRMKTAVIADKTRSPFNIGHTIELRGFRLSEALQSLLSFLKLSSATS